MMSCFLNLIKVDVLLGFQLLILLLLSTSQERFNQMVNDKHLKMQVNKFKVEFSYLKRYMKVNTMVKVKGKRVTGLSELVLISSHLKIYTPCFLLPLSMQSTFTNSKKLKTKRIRLWSD